MRYSFRTIAISLQIGSLRFGSATYYPQTTTEMWICSFRWRPRRPITLDAGWTG